jgi:hypothetical protein
MPTIRLLPASEEKSWRALLDTEKPVHCFKSKEKGKLYLVSRHQLEVLERLQLPFEEIPEDARASVTGG